MLIADNTLWTHQPCSKPMSFGLNDQPDKQGEYCEICRTEDTSWVFDRFRDGSTDIPLKD